MSTIYHKEQLLDRAAMIVIRRMIGGAKGSVVGPEARAAFDEPMEKTPEADDVTYEAVSSAV